MSQLTCQPMKSVSLYVGYKPINMLSGLKHLRTHECVGQPLVNVVDWTEMGAVTPVKNRKQYHSRSTNEEIELEIGLGFCVDGGTRLPDLPVRWSWWALAMVPFRFVVFQLVVLSSTHTGTILANELGRRDCVTGEMRKNIPP